MPSSLADRLDSLQRKPAAMRGEGVCKKVADPDGARALGRVIERAIEIVGSTRQAVAHELGYRDASSISRWINGSETAPMAKLWALSWLQIGLLLALAEAAEERSGIEVKTIVTVTRRREEVA